MIYTCYNVKNNYEQTTERIANIRFNSLYIFVKIKWYIIYMYLVLRKQLLSFKEDCVKNKIFHIQDLCLRTPGTNLLYKKCVQK